MGGVFDRAVGFAAAADASVGLRAQGASRSARRAANAAESATIPRVESGSKPISDVIRAMRFAIVFGCTRSIRAVLARSPSH
ncbi:hypothetical protein DY023_04975 [Microbacterium bovistercoris]|uniref:Uncharacterized protein n=1 Tax=Microbacterium bovistercoris TaxID=2293570 RepID=A0A371NVS6_9MICO|nr:hypothetical protein DY023_04975 [Microbacterium bovistercoris]